MFSSSFSWLHVFKVFWGEEKQRISEALLWCICGLQWRLYSIQIPNMYLI